MGKFDKYHNKTILEQGLEAFLTNGAPRRMVKALKDVAKEVQANIEKETNHLIPVYTGNLRNSIGVAVYERGKLVDVTVGPDPIPTNPPHVQSAGAAATGDYGRAMFNIIGTAYFHTALHYERWMAKHAGGPNAYHIVVFAAAPYAAYINEYGAAKPGHHWGKGAKSATASGGRGQGFFNELVGWSLWGPLGRKFFKGNKSFIKDAYPIMQG